MTLKEIMHNNIVKAAAFAAVVGCFAGSLYIGENTIADMVQDGRGSENGFYNFEESFQNSSMLMDVMDDLALVLENGLTNGYTQTEFEEGFSEQTSLIYYAELDDTVLKNADLTEQKVMQYPAYLIYSDGMMVANYSSGRFNMSLEDFTEKDAVILIGMGEEQYSALEEEWTSEKNVIWNMRNAVIAMIAVALVLYIYLLCVTGRTGKTDAIHLVTIDRFFVEVHVLLGLVPLGAAMTVNVMFLVNYIDYGYEMRFFLLPSIVIATAAFVLTLELSLSLVRNLKNRTFLAHSLVICFVRRFCHCIVRLGKNFGKGIRQMLHMSYRTWIAVAAFLIYAIVQFWLSMMLLEDDFFLLWLVIWFCAGICFLVKRIGGFERIVSALHAMRDGDLEMKLTGMPAGVFSDMADDLNSLGEGLQTALEKAVRAERMKSELITNVSHDLKTPLTSIISYSELLSKEQLTPDEANDYVKIIHQKSLRLKNLVNDLFVISKVQSGAEEIQREEIDVCTLVRQALAEQESLLSGNGIALKAVIPDNPIVIMADGRKMSRVLENLLVNCAKYALTGTRVFVTVSDRESTAEIEIKNTANYVMDFDAEEIAERFVRGDVSRSTEGSGLGLAIARSYTEACGGKFSVQVDGDQFKVIIQFIRG